MTPEEQEKLEDEEGKLQIIAQNALGHRGYEILANRISRDAQHQAHHLEQKLYGQAWIKWKDLQYIMVFEEFAELQKELVKKLRGKGDGDKIREEVADCLIMIEQLMVMFGPEKVLEVKARKIQRLKEMLA